MTALASLAPAGGFYGVHGLIDADEVQARLVEARACFDRLDRKGGQWAKDAPWHLSRGRRELIDYTDAVVGALELNETIETVVKEARPDRDLITRAEQAVAWLALVETDADRKLINLVTSEMAQRGLDDHHRVRWAQMLRAMGMTRGKDGLAKRYRRALLCLANRLNG